MMLAYLSLLEIFIKRQRYQINSQIKVRPFQEKVEVLLCYNFYIIQISDKPSFIN